jgi:hypothetical protein
MRYAPNKTALTRGRNFDRSIESSGFVMASIIGQRHWPT